MKSTINFIIDFVSSKEFILTEELTLEQLAILIGSYSDECSEQEYQIKCTQKKLLRYKNQNQISDEEIAKQIKLSIKYEEEYDKNLQKIKDAMKYVFKKIENIKNISNDDIDALAIIYKVLNKHNINNLCFLLVMYKGHKNISNKNISNKKIEIK